MICSKCSSENPVDKKFCGECGMALVAAPENISAGEGAWYCAKHTKTITRLRCGRCEAAICPKCTVYSPAGTRCRACARNKIKMRPAGVLHDVGNTLGDAGRRYGSRVWYLALWYFILSLFGHGGE